jgi:hypothetical protein
MLVSSFNLWQSFNYTTFLFYKKNGSNQRSILSVYGPRCKVLYEHVMDTVLEYEGNMLAWEHQEDNQESDSGAESKSEKGMTGEELLQVLDRILASEKAAKAQRRSWWKPTCLRRSRIAAEIWKEAAKTDSSRLLCEVLGAAGAGVRSAQQHLQRAENRGGSDPDRVEGPDLGGQGAGRSGAQKCIADLSEQSVWTETGLAVTSARR